MSYLPFDMSADRHSEVAIDAHDVVSTDSGQLSIDAGSGLVFLG